MNVLHLISGNLDGGAAKGVYTLHKGLKRQGIQSNILCNSNFVYDTNSEKTINKTLLDSIRVMFYSKMDKLPVKLFKNRTENLFSTGIAGINFFKHPAYKAADIIHLHWINHGFVKIKDIKKINKPLVWTVRDLWPFTGGCHLPVECDKYKMNCGKCPELGSSRDYDLSRFVFNRKQRHYPDHMNLVGISPWISDQMKQSTLFRNQNVQTIFNCIDTKTFSPIDKKQAKKILNVADDKIVLLTGAQNLNESNKGFSVFAEALQKVDPKKYQVLTFGKISEKHKENIQSDIKSFGFLHDEVSLRLLYSASDLFVAPSFTEPFGKTIVEAMACGTPALAFNATGPADIIDHKINGYLAEPYSSVDLANGIHWLSENSSEMHELSAQARKKAVETFDMDLIAQEYMKLYHEIT